jgi:alpha-tubulin suppressor-like RCC1 family protein
VAGVSCIKPTAVATGYGHACALLSTGAVDCWGYDGTGALGNGESSYATFAFPVVAQNVSGATAIAAGGYHTCALSGTTWKCWGDNGVGEIGAIGSTLCNGQACDLTPSALISGASAFSTGNSDTCMIVSGGVECLGDATFAVTGSTTGSASPSVCNCTPSPQTIFSSLLTSPTAVSSHNTSACAIVSGGNVVCWGEDLSGQIGPNGMTSTCSGDDPCSTTPVAVPGVSNATAIATGSFFACALISGGTVECWGDNQDGTLGSSETALCGELTYACSSAPLKVAGLSGVTQIAAGDDFACALLSGGTVECWGDNGYDELGNAGVTGPCIGGSNVCSSSPVQVSGLTGATSIAAGGDFACAVVQSGGVMCWGYNSFGQLGNGNTTASLKAVPVQF